MHPPTIAVDPDTHNKFNLNIDQTTAPANYFHRTALAAKKFRKLYTNSRIYIVAPSSPSKLGTGGEAGQGERAAFGVGDGLGVEVVSVDNLPNALAGEMDEGATDTLPAFNGSFKKGKLEPLNEKDPLVIQDDVNMNH